MHFKIIILLLSMLWASSCSWIRTDPKTISGFQSKGLDLDCIKSVPEGLQELFSGEYTTEMADQKKILATFGCIDRALDIFSEFTRGSTPDSYTSRELQLFANRYLPEKTPIQDPFIRSIFELKRAIIGGNASTITKSEIKLLRDKLDLFANLIAPFAGHIRVLIKPDSASGTSRREASSALNRFVMSLSGILTDSPNSLEWKNLALFIRELELFTDTGRNSALAFVREQLPIFQYAKLLLVGGSETSIETSKWKPIFNSISHFYSALLLTSNTTDLLEQMSLEVQSTEEEQTRAVVKLTGLLRALIRDETLNSRPTVILVSDRFSKALLLNALVFPRSRGSLALRPFLETASLRRLSGAIVDQILKLQQGPVSVGALQAISENVISLLEQAAISNNPSPIADSALSLGEVLGYLSELTPLLTSSKQTQTIRGALQVARSVIPILIGKESDRLTPKDLRNLITKSLEVYSLWSAENEQPPAERIGASLEVLTRNPSPALIGTNQILKSVEDLSSFLALTSPETRVDWESLRHLVLKAMKLKSILFQTPEASLNRFELGHITFLLDPFRKGGSLGEALTALSSLLQIRGFQSASLSDLVAAVDSLLPVELRTASLGLTPSMISHLKALLVGGDPASIARNEYSDLARLAGAITTGLEPLNHETFTPQLDSRTVSIAGIVLRAVMDHRKGYILMSDLKSVLLDFLRKWDLTPKESVVDRFLIGFHTRVLRKLKTERPGSLAGLTFSPGDLEVFHSLALMIRDELAPLESLFRTMGAEKGTLPRDLLLEHLSGVDSRKLVKLILPLLNGPDHRLSLGARGDRKDLHSQFELSYKIVIYKAVSQLFLLYKISEDPAGPAIPRLSEIDLTDLLSDLNDMITDLRLSYGYTPPDKSAKSRLRSIDLFTRNANGDEYIDAIETTEFLTLTLGGKKILTAVEEDLYPSCFPGRSNFDEISSIPVSCLSKTFFRKDQLKKYYDDATPELTRDIPSWDPESLEDFRKSMLNSIDPRWTSTGALDRADLEALISIPNYTETLFQRFDLNSNSFLEFSEAMAGFPVFCAEIRKTGGTSIRGSCRTGENPDQIEAVYGYLLFRGVPPRGIRPTDSLWQRLRAAKDILSWFSFWRKLDKSPDVRDSNPPKIDRKGILKIMSNLSSAT
jgi:hypothetical protein